ncbi:Lipocalin-like domain [Teratosphaeria destructans]|uniref:Lipocalin-like domain n=1 Tax=Teratosphaeria destructans TaxID=418781 RepID=A0A9W7SSJ2_9PEZI|nr:Lipocalin-like domain [Teratosphaeria destructans]
MSAMTSQYLQVPKVLPHRKRSRSRSRQREQARPVPSPEVVPTTKFRPESPPMPAVDSHVKLAPIGYANGYKTAAASDKHTNGYRNGVQHPQSSFPVIVEQKVTSYDDLGEDTYTLEQCRTPPPPEPLRQRLIGAWKLESYIAYPTPASPIQRPTYPMTKNVTGFIMYTPDGYMSAQMLIPGQQSFKRGEGEEPQWAEAGKRFFAYSGPYYINDEGPGREEILRHTFQCCNLPGWIGDIQIRTHKFEEDGQVLVLGSEEPTEIKACLALVESNSVGNQANTLLQGDKRIPVLKWRRAKNNVDAKPPPPTPQIKISGPGEP